MHPLAAEILAYIRSEPGDEETFSSLALELFAYQFEHNEAYRLLCESLGSGPSTVKNWQDIPPAPARAFKRCSLSCVPADRVLREFHSSGTTGPETSRHLMDADALALYEESLSTGFEAAMPSDRPREIWAMMQNPKAAPHSSLGHMLSTLGASRFYWDDNRTLAEELRRREAPLTLFGTAFAFVDLFDSGKDNGHLPAGSVVVETGGFKGRTREVPREQLYEMISSRLGVPLDRCYSEYGMSEMASQFYSRGLDPVKRGPHWVRSFVIDPATGSRIDRFDSAGILAHLDLANFNSVCALQTEDMALMNQGGFILSGRAEDSELRGCSLTVEELWTRE